MQLAHNPIAQKVQHRVWKQTSTPT